MKENGIRFRIKNIGPVEDFDLPLKTGVVNRLTGENGAGKTTVILALLRALGDDSFDVEPKHGAKIGTVEGPDDLKSVVYRSGKVRSEGQAPFGAADLSAVTDLITGKNRVTEDAREKARLEAFVRLVDPQVDEEAIGVLCELDEQLREWLQEKIASQGGADLLVAADILQKELYRRAREKEKDADQMQGRHQGLNEQTNKLLERVKLDLGDQDLKTLQSLAKAADPEEATADAEDALRELERAESSHQHRLELLEMQSQAREASGEEPDLSGARQALRTATEAESEAYEALVRAQERHEQTKKDVRQANARLDETKTAHDRWEQNQEVLNREVKGATEAEVQAAQERLDEKRSEAETARLLVEWREAMEAKLEVAKDMRAAKERGESLRTWGQALTERVADILEDRGVEGWTVQANVLSYRDEEHGTRPFDEMSPGERVRAAIELAIPRFRGLVPIAAEFYRGDMDDEARKELDRIAAEREDIIIITETATSGPLGVKYGAPPAEEGASS